MTRAYIDVETSPCDPSDPRVDELTTARKPREEAWASTALDGAHARIIGIGLALDDGPVETRWADHTHERDLLDWLADAIPVGAICVAHNAEFDAAMLWQRAIVSGSRLRVPHPRDWDCTMRRWTRSYRGMIGLDRLARALGTSGKLALPDGVQVWQVLATDPALADAYLRADVEALRQVDRRLTQGDPR